MMTQETTVNSRKEYLAQMTLDLDDVAEVTELPIEYIEGLYQDHDVLDAAVVGDPPRLRPYAIAALLLVTELADLVTAGAFTPRDAAQVYQQTAPRVREAFDGLVVREYDFKHLDITVTLVNGNQVKLHFLIRAFANFVTWLTRAC